jgi:hypothetical protein
MTKKRKNVPAVFKEDLNRFLTKAGELNAVSAGERTCLVCNKIVTTDSIQLIIPKDGLIHGYVCNDPECVELYNHEND